jgi:hypothetical protein
MLVFYCLIGHFFFFLLSLMYIGFVPMLQNILLLLWGYSVYLTLREWAIIIYIILIITCLYAAIEFEYYYDKSYS